MKDDISPGNGSKSNLAVVEQNGVRSAIKHTTIADALRRRIVADDLSPGSQLPTRSDIEREFGASSVTVQRALDALIQDGFVHATRRRGTFVAENPPHLSRYGLVFPVHPQRNPAHWTRFWSALSNEAVSMRRPGECELEFFTGLDGHTDSSDFERLEREVRNYRVAGLMLFLTPEAIAPILQSQPTLPLLQVGGDESSPGNALFALRLSTQSFVTKSLDYLQQRGCHRIAVISHRGPDDIYNRMFFEGARERGLHLPNHWLQSSGLDVPSAARNIAHLLLSSPATQRPQGLIITDDNLVEHATTGIAATGIQTPGELEVVAHCNFPWPTPSIVPSKRLGYDTRHVLETGVSLLNQMRSGSAQDVTIQAVFEDEVRVPKTTHFHK